MQVDKYYEELLEELKDEGNYYYLARSLVNYITSKEGYDNGNDILCEVIIGIITLLPKSDKEWCYNNIGYLLARLR